jgi:hypothetical protein
MAQAVLPTILCTAFAVLHGRVTGPLSRSSGGISLIAVHRMAA